MTIAEHGRVSWRRMVREHMDANNKIQHLINERIRLISMGSLVTLGYFSPEVGSVHIHVPSLTKDLDVGITVDHEEKHRGLTRSSRLGFFETMLGRLITVVQAPEQERRKARRLLEIIAGYSWMTHESYAVYGSLIGTIESTPDKLLAHVGALPDDPPYRDAWHIYADVLGVPTKDSGVSRILARSRISGCISEAALNVPILEDFRSYSDVSVQSVDDFLKQNNPDVLQRGILAELEAQQAIASILSNAESFLSGQFEETPKQETIVNALKTLAVITSRLDDMISRELREVISQKDLWWSYDQRLNEARAVFESWCKEWTSRGYGRTEALEFEDRLSTEDAIATNIEVFLEKTFIQLLPETMPLYRYTFTPLTLSSVRQHAEAVRETPGEELLISVRYDKDEVAFETVPWLRGHDGRFEAIWDTNARVFRQLAGPCSFSCPFDFAQELVDNLSSPNTVWLRWLEAEKELSMSSKQLRMPGLSFICAVGCTAKQVIERCRELATAESVMVSIWVENASRQEIASQAWFLVATSLDRDTFHILPIVSDTAYIVYEALESQGNINFVKEITQIEAGVNVRMLEIVLNLCYGVDSPAMIEVVKKFK